MGYIDIVFDGPPGQEPGGFVGANDENGAGIKVGEWTIRPDGHWALRIPTDAALRAAAPVLIDRVRELEIAIADCAHVASVTRTREELHDGIYDIAEAMLGESPWEGSKQTMVARR